jgi:hypothetical protein
MKLNEMNLNSRFIVKMMMCCGLCLSGCTYSISLEHTQSMSLEHNHIQRQRMIDESKKNNVDFKGNVSVPTI